MADTPLCECGGIQSINHAVEACPSTKFEERLRKPYGGQTSHGKMAQKTYYASEISKIITTALLLL